MKTVWNTKDKTLGAELHAADVSQLEKVIAIGRMLNGLEYPEGQPLIDAVGAVLEKFSRPKAETEEQGESEVTGKGGS